VQAERRDQRGAQHVIVTLGSGGAILREGMKVEARALRPARCSARSARATSSLAS
jgi:fructose-1-phosphate kinase PfkB-like protein